MQGTLRGHLDTGQEATGHAEMRGQLARLHAQIQLLDLIHDAIIVRDMSGAIIFWNTGAEYVYGWSRDEALGTVSYDFLKTSFPKPIEDITADLFRCGRWEGELAQSSRDGSELRTSSRWSLLSSAEGEHLAIFQIDTDITERRLIEEKLAAFAIQLQRSNRELEEFAAVASHDLQEPLRKIQAFGDRLAAKCAGSLDADGLDYLNRMLTSATRMRTLIDDLLDYSRLGIKSRNYVKVDLSVVCRDVVGDLGEQIERMGGRVEIGELPVVEADAMQMRRLMQNLISNGLKFSREGVSPFITVRARPAQLSKEPHSGEHAATELWEIMVRDEGIGFDGKYLDRIFAPFQRLHGRNEFEGTGMGLAICRKIAESHWGSITAESTPGQGATFLVTLPTTQPTIKPTAQLVQATAVQAAVLQAGTLPLTRPRVGGSL